MSGGVVIVGAVYEDASGKRYSVFDLAIDADERRVVIYAELETGEVRVLTLDEWCAEVDGAPRFRVVT